MIGFEELEAFLSCMRALASFFVFFCLFLPAHSAYFSNALFCGNRLFGSGAQTSRTAKPNNGLPVLEETAVLNVNYLHWGVKILALGLGLGLRARIAVL